MSWLFEDSGEDRFSSLFKQEYSSDKIKDFIYLKGITNAEEIVRNLLISTNGTYILYMDIVPDNKEVVRVYADLRLLSIEYNYRLIVIPIPCMEYQFISTFPYLIKDKEILQRCLNKDPYYDLKQKFSEPNEIKTFEKFCKHILIDFTKDCACTATVKQYGGLNPAYNRFFKGNCPCELAEKECRKLTCVDKASLFLQKMPCIPSSIELFDSVKLSKQDLWELHNKCVLDTNIMIEKYLNNKVNIKDLSLKIEPIKY